VFSLWTWVQALTPASLFFSFPFRSEYEQELETHRSKLDQLKGLEAMAA
jgi:hypothetical protein